MRNNYQIVSIIPGQFDVSRTIALARGVLRLWYDRWSSRQDLRRLDEAGLADIGLTRADALQEAAKPFWEA
jgi:uncharacterized protein YjiS (DUF1127 family)